MITELMLNHSSSRHPAFKAALRGDPAHRDWYIFVPSEQVPRTLGPCGQQVWQLANGQHYYGIFWSGMPDLNYHTSDVTAEAYRIADFWLSDVGVERFRLDAVRHLIEDGDPDSLLNHYRRLIRLRQSEPALATGGLAAQLLHGGGAGTSDDTALAPLTAYVFVRADQ